MIIHLRNEQKKNGMKPKKGNPKIMDKTDANKIYLKFTSDGRYLRQLLSEDSTA